MPDVEKKEDRLPYEYGKDIACLVPGSESYSQDTVNQRSADEQKRIDKVKTKVVWTGGRSGL